VRIVRTRHAWEGQPLELMGWMHRRGRLELILILPDGSHLMVPAVWTDLQATPEPVGTGTLCSLEDLLATRRALEPLLERVVLSERDPSGEEIDRAAATRTGRESGARRGAVGARRRAAAADGDEPAGGDDRPNGRARGRR
jgi:hypothetical protein